MSFQPGQTVGDYRILAMAGTGGMGEVYRTEHIITRRSEALKILKGGCSGEFGARFLREIQVQASLSHPNIAAVHTAFVYGDDLALVMEMLDGTSLARILTGGRIPLSTCMVYADQILAALEYAHNHGVIHRDVAPSNIIVTSQGLIKLTDFGLAKRQSDVQVSQSGAFVGSPHYMSPEQARAEDRVDARSDIYSTGAVLYELVTGRKVFESDSVFQLLSYQVQRKPAPPIQVAPEIPRGLNNVILKALAKDPAARFQSAVEFRAALRSCAMHPSGSGHRLKHLVLGVASALVVVVAGLWCYLEWLR